MATIEAEIRGVAGGLAGTETLEEALERMVEYVLATPDFERVDRLWPSHSQVFSTNPLSLAYGACGTALFLHRATGELPARVREWLLAQPVSREAYPPGLFMGAAGVALAFAELGLEERAEEVMREAYASPLRLEEPGVFLGVAGWGLAALSFWDRTRGQEHLDQAVRAGEHLLETAGEDGETRFWKYVADDRVHYGLGFGSSGIALFLLNLALRTGRDDFLRHARMGVEHDLANKLDTVNGTTFRRFEGDGLNYPYLLHGGAGIGSVVTRFARHVDREHYERWAAEIGGALDMKWTVHPGLLHGLAGVGEFSLDLYHATGDEQYLERAHDQAETLLWFGIPMPEGLAFPGRMLLKVSNDWGTGSAGVGMFLHRLLHGGERLILDLDLAVEGA